MSVYTVVERAALEGFLADYAVGELHAFEGIPAGIENTNYFVSTSRGEFVLTLFEFTPREDLPYFLDVMAYLAEHAVPCAHPVADREGRYLRTLAGRPAALVQRLPGSSVDVPEPRHCRALGAEIARMHLASRGFGGYRANDRGLAWQEKTARAVLPYLEAADRSLLRAAIDEDFETVAARLPGGVIHADMFRDNVLFENHRLTGVIDFYYAFNGCFVYDLAVAVSDWCFDAGVYDATRAAALVQAYETTRRVTAAERAVWGAAIRAAGLRFWLSRLKDQLFPRAGALTHIKDPGPFRQVLLHGRDQAPQLSEAWEEP